MFIISTNQEHIVNSSGALEFDSVPSKLAIVGGGIIGLELGSVWARLGSEVTIIEVMEEFLPKADKRIARDVLRTLKDQGLNICLASEVIETSSDSEGVRVRYKQKDEFLDIEVDKLIVAVGRKPNIENLGLEKLGVNLNEGVVVVDEYQKTNISNVYAIGDVTDRLNLTPVAIRETASLLLTLFSRTNQRYQTIIWFPRPFLLSLR